VKAFVINLDRAAERFARVQSRFAPLGLEIVRVCAPDARASPDWVLSQRGLSIIEPPDVLLYNTYDFRSLELAEEACFQGHLRALRAFLGCGEPHGLILEDDAAPKGDVAAAIALALANAHAWDIVKLESIRQDGSRLAVPLARASGLALVYSLKASMGAAAYLVSRAGAEKLLAAGPKHFEPWDYVFAAPSLHGARMLDIAPFPVKQEGGDSFLHPDWPNHKRARRRGAGVALARAVNMSGRRLARWPGFLLAMLSGRIPRSHPW
jgi:glycosyl transferase, family 25